MVQDKDILTINLTDPTPWDQLDNTQLRYVFGLLAQGFPSPQVKTYCLFLWTGMRVMQIRRERICDLGRAKKRQRRRRFSRKSYTSDMDLKEFYNENIG